MSCARPNVTIVVQVEAACELHANALRDRIEKALESMLRDVLPIWEAQVAAGEQHAIASIPLGHNSSKIN